MRNIKFPVLLTLLFGFLLWQNWSLNAQSLPAGSPHKVTLTWVAPAIGAPVGYNVYRSTSGANFSKINTALISGLTTIDNNVTGSTTYAYCASSVDSKNLESPCSIQVSATVPADRNPPTGLAAASE